MAMNSLQHKQSARFRSLTILLFAISLIDRASGSIFSAFFTGLKSEAFPKSDVENHDADDDEDDDDDDDYDDEESGTLTQRGVPMQSRRFRRHSRSRSSSRRFSRQKTSRPLHRRRMPSNNKLDACSRMYGRERCERMMRKRPLGSNKRIIPQNQRRNSFYRSSRAIAMGKRSGMSATQPRTLQQGRMQLKKIFEECKKIPGRRDCSRLITFGRKISANNKGLLKFEECKKILGQSDCSIIFRGQIPTKSRRIMNPKRPTSQINRLSRQSAMRRKRVMVAAKRPSTIAKMSKARLPRPIISRARKVDRAVKIPKSISIPKVSKPKVRRPLINKARKIEREVRMTKSIPKISKPRIPRPIFNKARKIERAVKIPKSISIIKVSKPRVPRPIIRKSRNIERAVKIPKSITIPKVSKPRILRPIINKPRNVERELNIPKSIRIPKVSRPRVIESRESSDTLGQIVKELADGSKAIEVQRNFHVEVEKAD